MPDISDNSVDSFKKALRSDLLKQRRQLGAEFRQEQSVKIIERLVASECFKNATSILLYYSLADEVSTVELLNHLPTGKQIFLPTIVHDEIVTVPFSTAENVTLGKYGIVEPQGAKMAQESYKFDLIVMPGVGFDRHGNRLGMGKGYYDHFLKKCSGTAVALAFSFQVVDKIPTASYDVPVSLIFTPNETIQCKPTSTFLRS